MFQKKNCHFNTICMTFRTLVKPFERTVKVMKTFDKIKSLLAPSAHFSFLLSSKPFETHSSLR